MPQDSTYAGMDVGLEDSDDFEPDDDAEKSSTSDEDHDPDEFDKDLRYPVEALEGEIFGSAIMSLVIDSRVVLGGWAETSVRAMHCCRLLLSLLLVLFTVGLQLYLTVETKLIVTPVSVNAAREAYGRYEQIMYNDHTTLTEYGHHRGIDGFFDMTQWKHLPKDDQDSLCTLSLTQPGFLFSVLLLWVLTVAYYLRKNTMMVVKVCNVGSDVTSITDRAVFKKNKDGEISIVRLPCYVKALIIVFILLPQFITIVILGWIGCRWLIATMGFGDVLLNAVALEFILVFQSLLYNAIVPMTMQLRVATIAFRHPVKRGPPGFCKLFGTFIIFFAALAFTAIYMGYMQQVLPDYKWDVKKACDANEPQAGSFFT